MDFNAMHEEFVSALRSAADEARVEGADAETVALRMAFVIPASETLSEMLGELQKGNCDAYCDALLEITELAEYVFRTMREGGE